MKKTTLLLIVSLNTCSVSAQSGNHLLVSDNYGVPVNRKGAVVGKILSPEKGKVSLVKDTSGLFEMDKDRNIKLKKGKQVDADSPVSYEILLKEGNNLKSIELVKDEFIHNKVIAHRGAWKNQDFSHNSMSSLKHAVEMGCEGSEIDVRLSSDDVIVLSHDPSIGGKEVEETTAEELSEIPLKNGDFVPTLEEQIRYIKTQNKTKLVIEIKGTDKGKAIADSVVFLVHRMRAQAWVDYISFGIEYLIRVKELDPAAKVLYLGSDKSPEELKAANMDGVDFHYSLFRKDDNLAAKAKAMGLLTNVWTVNKEEEMRTMLKQDVDLITTDEPELLFKLIREPE
jgi:glycerophosphoryl diester phosphodiesterase